MKNVLMFILALATALPLTACTSKHEHAEKAAETYVCPMHPEVKRSEPGQCPICGMNLEKVAPAPAPTATPSPGASVSGHASINLSSVRSQMIGVKLGTVEKRPLFKTIRAAGRLAYDPELYAAQTEYREALKQLESVHDSPLGDVRQSAKRMAESAKLRLKILGLSDSQIEKLSHGKTSDSALLINKAGESAWIYADIYEIDLASVRPGLSAEITAQFLGGKTLSAKVVSVDRVLNPTTRTAKARILLSEARSLLRPESYVDVNILSPMGEQITVPFDAIFDTGKEAWIFTADGQGNYTPRKVKIKFTAGDDVAIESGVAAGEQIVISANFLIDSESRLKSTLMASAETKAPSCPKGQHWDEPMKMCMPDTGS